MIEANGGMPGARFNGTKAAGLKLRYEALIALYKAMGQFSQAHFEDWQGDFA